MWQDYGNEGWPARYLFDGRARLFEYHHGEGGYRETELAIQELVGVEREPMGPLRPEDAPGARLCAQTEDQPGAYSGPYEAGGVWAVLDGAGVVSVSAGGAGGGGKVIEVAVTHPGAYPLIEHERHTAGMLRIVCEAGVRVPGDLLHAGRGLTSTALRPRRPELGVGSVEEQPLEARVARSPRRARRFPASRGSRRGCG